MSRKIVTGVASLTEAGHPVISVVCEDGASFLYDTDYDDWREMTPLPDSFRDELTRTLHDDECEEGEVANLQPSWKGYREEDDEEIVAAFLRDTPVEEIAKREGLSCEEVRVIIEAARPDA